VHAFVQEDVVTSTKPMSRHCWVRGAEGPIAVASGHIFKADEQALWVKLVRAGAA